MEQKIVRSYQTRVGHDETSMNHMLSQGWSVVCANVMPATDDAFGYIEYVLVNYSTCEEVEND
jgi:hypothetical protein